MPFRLDASQPAARVCSLGLAVCGNRPDGLHLEGAMPRGHDFRMILEIQGAPHIEVEENWDKERNQHDEGSWWLDNNGDWRLR